MQERPHKKSEWRPHQSLYQWKMDSVIFQMRRYIVFLYWLIFMNLRPFHDFDKDQLENIHWYCFQRPPFPSPPPPIPPLCICGAISSLVFNSKPRSNYILVALLLLFRRGNWSKLNVKKTWNCLFLKSYYAVHVFHWISKLTPFITSILKSLMIPAIWLALNSVIYSRIALLFLCPKSHLF